MSCTCLVTTKGRLTGSLDQLGLDTFSARDEKHRESVSSVDTDREVVGEVTAVQSAIKKGQLSTDKERANAKLYLVIHFCRA